MRILLDLQGCQSASRQRGIGRYCLALAEGIARNAGAHEVWVLLSDLFPDTVMPLREHLSVLIPPQRIVVFAAPGPVAEGDPANWPRARAAELIREHAIAAIAPDVVHVGSLFEGYVDNAVTSVGMLDAGAPTAVTLYDLIPLRNPDTYLVDPGYRAHYQRKIESLERADTLLAISASAATEAIESLGLPAERVSNISAAIDGRFCRAADAPGVVDTLRRRLGLTRPFVMHIGVIEPRKNFEGLIRAWALLPPALRRAHQLLLVAQGPDSEHQRLRRLAEKSGLDAADLVMSAHVDDADLVALYRNCRLFAFPSLHEGFGLPVLEAMACGAVVVASDTSSLPEVVGDPDMLFDPRNDQDVARQVERALSDDALRRRFLMHATRHCERFSWDETARRTIAALEQIATRRRPTLPAEAYAGLMQALAAQPGPLAETEWPALAEAIAENLPPPARPRLFVDISELAERDARTGIQRVVRAILQRLLDAPPAGFDVAPVRFDRDGGRYRLARRYVATLRREPGATAISDPLLETWRGDIFLGLDLIADRLPQAMPWLARQRRRGLRVAVVAYDTLPLRHPEWWPEGTGAMFERWATLIASETDLLLGISRSVVDDFAAWAHEHELPLAPRLAWFHLGADVRNTAPSGGLPHDADETLAAIARAPAFLMVGTLEPRKGHAQALDAFEQLWQDGVQATLVIVGKTGWMVDALVERLRTHPMRGRQLFWLEGASDEYLEALYTAASVLLAPSLGEGFGLPLIEGAQHGLPIIARDLPVFREVAGEHASYFSGTRAADLAAAIARWLRAPDAAPGSTALRPLSWAESAAQLLEALGFTGTPAAPATSKPDPRMVGFADAVRNGWYRQDTGELLQGFPITADDTVLDLGCGAGIATIFAAQRGASVTFADVDARVVHTLEGKIKTSAARAWRGIVTDADPLPLADASASRIVSMEVLEHVADPARVIRELVRVAAPGALFLLAVPDAQSEAIQRTVAPDAYFETPNHIRVFSPEGFEALVGDAGLVIERRHTYSCFWNIGMALYWLSMKVRGDALDGPALNLLEPPYPPLLEDWAGLWQQLMAHAEAGPLLAEFDRALPKSRILIARKPA